MPQDERYEAHAEDNEEGESLRRRKQEGAGIVERNDQADIWEDERRSARRSRARPPNSPEEISTPRG